MNQHRFSIDRLQPRANRIGALITPFDQFTDIEPRQGRLRKFLLPVADHDPNCFDGWMHGQGFDCPAQHGFTAKLSILLGETAAHTFAFAGGDNECSDGHGASV